MGLNFQFLGSRHKINKTNLNHFFKSNKANIKVFIQKNATFFKYYLLILMLLLGKKIYYDSGHFFYGRNRSSPGLYSLTNKHENIQQKKLYFYENILNKY